MTGIGMINRHIASLPALRVHANHLANALARQQKISLLNCRLPTSRLLHSTSFRAYSDGPAHGSAPEFEAKWSEFFINCKDHFEFIRGLNNCFTYDIVPTAAVIEKAILAARRMNDLSAATRIFEALREKCENKEQYMMYVKYFESLRNDLGIPLPEELGR